MEKSTKIVIGIVSAITAIAAGVIVYAVVSNRRNNGTSKKDEPTPGTQDGGGVENGVNAAVRNDNFPLKFWSYGDKVTNLQKALNKMLGQKGKAPISVDGDFQGETEGALKAVGCTSEITEAVYNAIVKNNSCSTSTTPVNTTPATYVSNTFGRSPSSFIGKAAKTRWDKSVPYYSAKKVSQGAGFSWVIDGKYLGELPKNTFIGVIGAVDVKSNGKDVFQIVDKDARRYYVYTTDIDAK